MGQALIVVFVLYIVDHTFARDGEILLNVNDIIVGTYYISTLLTHIRNLHRIRNNTFHD